MSRGDTNLLDQIAEFVSNTDDILEDEDVTEEFRPSKRSRESKNQRKETYDVSAEVRLLKLDLQESRLLRESDAKKSSVKIRALKEENAKQTQALRKVLGEMDKLRKSLARQQSTTRESATVNASQVAEWEIKLSKARDEVSKARHRAISAERRVRALEETLNDAEFECEREYRERIAELEANLAVAEVDAENRSEEDEFQESKKIRLRLGRELEAMTRRAEDAESRLKKSLPSRELYEEHTTMKVLMKRREDSLLASIRKLEGFQRSGSVAKERIQVLESKIKTLQNSNDKLTSEAVEVPELRGKVEEWVKTMKNAFREDKSPVITPTMAAARVSDLQRQNALLLQSKGNAEIAEHTARRDQDHAKELLDNMTRKYNLTQKKLDEEVKTSRLLRTKLSVSEKDRISLNNVIKVYSRKVIETKEESVQNELSALRKRVQELEKIQIESTKLFETTLKSSSSANTVTKKSRILHFKMNPAAKAIKEKEKQDRAELRALRKEVKALRESWSSKNVTTPMPGNFSATAPTPSTAGGGDLQTRYERLKEVFHKRMQRFREAVYLLTGFKVDMENTNESPRLRLRSIFAEREQDFLMFQWKANGGMDLCQTESVRRDFTDSVMLYLHQMDSIPAFLASVTLQLFDQTTVAIKNTS